MTDLTQVSSILKLNKEKLNPKVDIDQIEKDIIGSPVEEKEVIDIDAAYSEAIGEIDDASLDGEYGTKAPTSTPFTYTPGPTTSRSEFSRPESKYNDRISDVLKSYDSEYTDEVSKEEDIKSLMLEEIDYIRDELSEEMDISKIPTVSHTSSTEEVRNIRKVLQLKYDRKRYSSLATDTIIALVKGIEMIFDGTRKIGPYAPDLTGWSQTVRQKLRRMQVQTAQIVSNIIDQNHIGPLGQLGLELVPSLLLHSKMRSDRKKAKSYTEEDMAEAYNSINE